MLFDIHISLSALEDLETAVNYYNAQSDNLGYSFGNAVDIAFQKIAETPAYYSFRYKNIRAKQVYKFPNLFYFVEDIDKQAIFVLRIFNTHQNNDWLESQR